MATERFTIDKKGGVFYLFDNGNLIPISDGQPICDLLNTLHETNEQLRHDATILIQSNQDYRKENEQLKKDVEYYKTERLALFEYLDKKDDLKLELKVER